MKFYIASKFENAAQVQAVRDVLVAAGHTHTFDWTRCGLATSAHELAEVGAAEMDGVAAADVVIVLLPGGFGTHVELGAANALGIPVLLVAPTEDDLKGAKPCPFYWNANVRRFWGASDRLGGFLAERLARMEQGHMVEDTPLKHIFDTIFTPLSGKGGRA